MQWLVLLLVVHFTVQKSVVKSLLPSHAIDLCDCLEVFKDFSLSVLELARIGLGSPKRSRKSKAVLQAIF